MRSILMRIKPIEPVIAIPKQLPRRKKNDELAIRDVFRRGKADVGGILLSQCTVRYDYTYAKIRIKESNQ